MLKSSEFLQPSADYRILPFWFWNGSMEKPEIERQIQEMSEKGLGGFYICARQGMSIPYLSGEWFELVKYAIELAGSYGLHVWLYDEYPYPSGIAGGEVILRHPEAIHRTISHHAKRASGRLTLELPWGNVLSAIGVPVDPVSGVSLWEGKVDLTDRIGNLQEQQVFQKVGLTAYNDKRFFSAAPKKKLLWTAPDTQWDIIVVMEEMMTEFKYYGTFVDPCHDEAMETFIELTHKRYEDTMGELFGGLIKGMFTDEIGLQGSLPWSPTIPAFFAEQTGYSLLDRLPDLYYSSKPGAARTRYDYFQSIHLKLRTNYYQRVRDWCSERQLQFIAEVPSVRASTQVYSDIPGGDSAHEKLGRSLSWILDRYTCSIRNNPKVTSSLARQLNRKRTLNECFHSVGWSMTLQDAKWMIDRLAALGVNMFNFHAFFYTIGGLTKHDAPPSQFYQNPYWPHFRQLSDYTARISYLMSQGEAVIRIAVIDPTTSLWTQLGNPFFNFKYGGTDEKERLRLEQLKQDWTYVCKSLLMSQLDYDHLDPEILMEAQMEGARLRIGQASYSIIILPPLSNLESAAWEKLKEFMRSGGIVIGTGVLPYEVIDGNEQIEQEMCEWFGLEESPRSDYWQNEMAYPESKRERQPLSKGELSAYFISSVGSLAQSRIAPTLISLVEQAIPSTLQFGVLEGKREAFLLQHRVMPDGAHVVFISNQEGQRSRALLKLKGAFQQGRAEEVHLETGATSPLQADNLLEGCEVELLLAPYESRTIRFTEAGPTERPESVEPHLTQTLKFKAKDMWKVSALQPNVLRLGTFSLMLEPDPTNAAPIISGETAGNGPVVEVKTLIDQCSDLALKEQFSLVFSQPFGIPMKYSLAYPLNCLYSTAFEVENLPFSCDLLMEEQAISGAFEIYLNGNRIIREQFKSELRHDCGNLTCEVGQWLRTGTNVLAVRVSAERDWDGLLDALYVTGQFGVYFRENRIPVIGSAATESTLHGSLQEGYPYYAGELLFERSLILDEQLEADQFDIAFEGWDTQFHDCAAVLINGHSLGVRCWSPYVWSGSTDLLRTGVNTIQFKRTNTLIGMLEGKYFDYEQHEVKDVITVI
jgi:hypothetical protein